MAAAGFPKFDDANVEIWLTKSEDDKLVLHTHVLSLHSPWFKASLSERWNTGADSLTLTKGASQEDSTKKWVYELRFEKGSSDGMLIKTPIESTASEMIQHSDPKKDSRLSMRGWRPNQARFCCVDAHRALLYALYHIRPTIALTNDNFTLDRLARYFSVAEAYGSEGLMKPHITAYFFDKRKDKEFYANDRAFTLLKLSIKLQSKRLWEVAASRLLGAPTRDWDLFEDRLEQIGVLSLFEQKRAAFVTGLQELDKALLSPAEKFGALRLSQLAYCIYAGWLTEEFQEGGGSAMGAQYASIYRLIAGPAPRLNAEKPRPLFAKACAQAGVDDEDEMDKVIPRIERLLELARPAVEPFLARYAGEAKAPAAMRQLYVDNFAYNQLPWAKLE